MERPCGISRVVFDLGGVVLSRNRAECSEETNRFFAFLRQEAFPPAWVEYDRGVISLREVAAALAGRDGCTPEEAMAHIQAACRSFAVFPQTEELIGELSLRGAGLYVLSNMPVLFYAHIRRFDVFRHFDGVVVSCEEHLVKPDPAFYRLLMGRYGLRPEETLFVDDRQPNIEAARELGLQTCHFTDPETGCAQIRTRLGL